MLAAIFFSAASSQVGAASSDPVTTPAVTAQLLTVENGIAPGAGTLSAGLALDLAEGWKTYWRTPGEVGFPPEIDWSGSQNIASMDFQWPAPERFTAFGIENFGYHDEVVFPIRITLEEPGAPVRLSADVTLLTCSDICVPQDFVMSLDLPSGVGIDEESAARITAFADRVPLDASAAGITDVSAHVDPDMRAVVISMRREAPFVVPDVFAELGPFTSLGRPDTRLGDDGHLLWARVPILSAVDGPLQDLSVTVTDSSGFAATAAPRAVSEPPEPPFAFATSGVDIAALIWIAATAFLGGLVLNAMPCVLPVLSIKLATAMRLGGDGRIAVRRGFLASAAGVMAFVWGLAAVLFMLREIGVTVGWGLQFQNPIFLSLTVLVLGVFAANLVGAFEIALPSRLQTRLAHAGSTPGLFGDFAAGAFAAVLATPCSAPFLGTAVAFALGGRGIDIAVVFTFLGLGLASPYLVIAARPGLVRRLPKPGRWMGVLRAGLGLLLGGTALWLVWVMIGVAGPIATLASVAMTAVIVGVLSMRGVSGTARSVTAAALAVVMLFATGTLSDGLSSRGTIASESGGIAWLPFERGEIARRISMGEVVFVDVTADWCLTCKANKALVLDRDPVAASLGSPGVVAMQADWTRPDEAISRYLEGFGRFGIPFNVVYGPGVPEGIVLPELLTADAVMDALDRAGTRRELSRTE
ncbi:copper-binding protein [Meridianimarinicoccus roseus]|uniref:Copper-binding protein n=2 Tax=Meridianimarinicoccus roseus TaxID=2072018 RepID=A0A2V2LAL9_9RHOB|nr:copper-binding protein [Meridianimarinicoccus roseus]